MGYLSTRKAKLNIVKKYIGAGDQFNTTEVANLLHMSRRELTRRVRTGEIRDSSKNTHIWVSKDDLAEYIVNNEYIEYAVSKNITFTLKQLGKIYRDVSWFKTLINRCDIKPLNSPLRNHVYRYIDIINAVGSEHSKLSVAERSDVIVRITEAFRKKLKAYDDYNNPDIHMQNSFQSKPEKKSTFSGVVVDGMPKNIFTAYEAAWYLQCCIDSIYKWGETGKLEVDKQGRRYQVSLSSINTFKVQYPDLLEAGRKRLNKILNNKFLYGGELFNIMYVSRENIEKFIKEDYIHRYSDRTLDKYLVYNFMVNSPVYLEAIKKTAPKYYEEIIDNAKGILISKEIPEPSPDITKINKKFPCMGSNDVLKINNVKIVPTYKAECVVKVKSIEAPVKEEAKPVDVGDPTKCQEAKPVVDGYGNHGKYISLKESVNQLYGVFKEELKLKHGDPDEAPGYKKDTSEYDDSDEEGNNKPDIYINGFESDVPAETKCKLCNSIEKDDEPIKTLLDNNERIKSLLDQPTNILTVPKHEHIGVHMTAISPDEIYRLDNLVEDPKKIVGGAVLKYRDNFMVKLGSVSIPDLTVRDQNRFLELLIDFEEDLKIFTNNVEPDNIEETTMGQLSKEMEV